MDRETIAAYAMQALMGQKSTAPAEEGAVFNYSLISTNAFAIADLLIDIFGTASDPDLYAVLAMEAMVMKVVNDGEEYDYTDIIQAAFDMSAAMSPV